jgi:nucleoside recognition membrane protein YjiH
MVPITALWLPILLSAVIVFVASSIMHMALPIHKNDYRKLPDEEKVLDAVRASGATPGRVYFFPFTTHKEMRSPAVIEKFKRGPVGFFTVLPSGPPSMAKNLVLWFLYSVLIGVFVAYLTGCTLTVGTPYLQVFRVAGTAAFLAYSFGQIQDSIWRGQTWGVTLKHVIDGLIYGLLTAGTFGWLWPKLQ